MSERPIRAVSRIRRGLVIAILLTSTLFVLTVVWPIYRKFDAYQVLMAADAFVDCDYHKESLAIGSWNDWTLRRRMVDERLGWPFLGVVRRIYVREADRRAVQAIRVFPQLVDLDIVLDDEVAAHDLPKLGRFEELERLNLHGAQITDREIASLANHKTLRLLSISSDGISDNSLPVFASIPQLNCLMLGDTSLLTEQGIREFLAGKPVSMFVCPQHQRYTRQFGKYVFVDQNSDTLHPHAPDRKK